MLFGSPEGSVKTTKTKTKARQRQWLSFRQGDEVPTTVLGRLIAVLTFYVAGMEDGKGWEGMEDEIESFILFRYHATCRLFDKLFLKNISIL